MKHSRVLFLTKYTARGASSRYRTYQYLPFLEEAGLECHVRPLLPDSYVNEIYSGRRRGRSRWRDWPHLLGWMARRWWLIHRELGRYDAVHLEYEALPYAPLWLESSLFDAKARVIVDYDDPIYLVYEQHANPHVRRWLGRKIETIARRSYGVVAANRTLADWAGRLSSRVTVIPTCVDLRKYPLRRREPSAGSIPVIGWIGSPSTASYLRRLERPLQALRARHAFVLKVIGVPSFSLDGIDVVGVPWTEDHEVEELQSCDVGLAPLADEPWARGKSALKLIQYMAAGVAAVASPVGTNNEVVEDGENGVLARSDEDWTEKVAWLLADPATRRRLAEGGRRTVEQRYSLQGNAPRLLHLLHETACAGA